MATRDHIRNSDPNVRVSPEGKSPTSNLFLACTRAEKASFEKAAEYEGMELGEWIASKANPAACAILTGDRPKPGKDFILK